ncbi:hypothetical protein [Poseidonibacter sp.]|uniref:hypothetical protein n=1 Tax=Poseidonibacter sp. TaxID=2321188 RepID=UPI00359D9D56
MQILIFSLIILLILVYVIYKIKTSFTKKELSTFLIVIVVIIVSSIYYNHLDNNRLPDSFKAKYLKDKNIEIEKLSMKQTNVEVLSNSKSIFKMIYIINKDGKDYVCEANDVEVLEIEDEFIFKDFKEECKIK